MAIYKPSNCIPFLTGLDLTQNQDLSFQINTNNIDVTGYKLKILDSNNNEVFSGAKFSPLNSYSQYLNNTTNGSAVKLPFVRVVNSEEDWYILGTDLGEMMNNIIVYCNYQIDVADVGILEVGKFYSFEFSLLSISPLLKIKEITNFYNEYSAQPYKWQVILSQGQQVQYRKFFDNDLPYIESNEKELFNGVVDINTSFSGGYRGIITPPIELGEQGDKLKVILNDKKIYLTVDIAGDIQQAGLIDKNGIEIVTQKTDGSTKQTTIRTERSFTAAQLSIINTETEQIPPDNKYYDMLITSGKIIGSTPNRLQGILSEKIFKNYFVQLYDENKKEISSRVLINSYDHTYGYIYPQENVFTTEDIANAKYFKIFKNTNNIEYINANRIVDCATSPNTPMGDVLYKSRVNSASWAPDKSGVYFYQEYYTTRKEVELGSGVASSAIPIPVNMFDKDAVSGINLQPGSSLLLVKNENNGDVLAAVPTSPYNGVFLFVSAIWKQNSDTGTDNGVLTIKWQRAAMADTWAEFIGQSFYVKTSGTNWDSNAQTNGTLNSTPLGFIQEQPIEIYPDQTTQESKTLGNLLKTNDLTKEGKKIVYIRPSSNIGTGNQFKYILKNGNTGILTVISVNTETWGILVEDTGVDFQPDQDSYYISSYFKISDENPFYAYSSPVVKIVDVNNTNTENLNNLVVYDRVLKLKGSYIQSSNRMWKSFYWSLIDLSVNQTTTTKISYSGSMSAEFIGIEDNKRYTVSLIVEDEFGNVYTDQLYITTQIKTVGNVFGSSFTKNIDCQTQSAEFNFFITSKVVPNNNEGISYAKEGEAVIPDSTDEKPYELIKNTESNYYYPLGYTQTLFMNEAGGFGFYGDVPAPTEDYFTINSLHSKLSQYFQGYLLGYQIGSNEFVGDYFFFLDTNTDNFKDNFGMFKVNPDRNKLTARVFVGDNEVKSSNITLTNANASWANSNMYWREQKPVVFSFQKPGYVINDNCDYIFSNYYYTNEGGTDKNLLYLVDGKGTDCGASGKFKGGPCDVQSSSQNVTDGFWSDTTIERKWQKDETTYIGVLQKGIYNKLPTNETGVKWFDKEDYGCYIPEDVNAAENHSGRQDFAGKTFTFNVVFGNYNINRQNQKDVEIISKCYIDDINKEVNNG